MDNNIVIPKSSNDNILIKVSKQEEPKEKILNFRSFAIPIPNGTIDVKARGIPISELYDLLKEHSLSPSLPMYVSLAPSKFLNFDWRPASYGGPRVWYFDWESTKCSITADNNSCLYIRIHDLAPGAGENVLDQMMSELFLRHKPIVSNKTFNVHSARMVNGVCSWITLNSKTVRDISTIFINEKKKDDVVNWLTRFLNSSPLYDKFGITWKCVNLFYGPPGVGKTSTVIALASMFKRGIAKLIISPDMRPEHIEYLFQTVPNGTWLLIEDIDALFDGRESKTGVDFSTILNALDGLSTARGMVVFLTTNHKKKLDPALIRPGRVDFEMEFFVPTISDFRNALKILAPEYAHEHEKFIESRISTVKSNKLTSGETEGSDVTEGIAQLQQYLFRCIMEKRESIL